MDGILTVTMNPAIDLSSQVDYVVAERKLRCDRPCYEPGGGGLNVSRAIHKLGGHSSALYTAGGSNGKLLRNLLDKEGIDHHPMEIADNTRESLTILEKSSGNQFRFGMPGPDVSDAEWRQCLATITGWQPKPAYIVLSGSVPPGTPNDFYARVARWAKDEDIKVVVDTTGEPLRLVAREGVYLIKLNMNEFEALFEQEVHAEPQMERLATDFVKSSHTEVLIVSLGAAGGMSATKDGTEYFRSPTVPIKSKVGAGDSMVGGMVLSLAKGSSLHDAVRHGVAAGAAAVMTPGTELCRLEDAERLLKLI